MLEASSVTRRFGSVAAVDNIDLKVHPGELFCLLGANGAGKTTTIHLFLGFLVPDAGTIFVGGVRPSIDPKGVRRKLAYIPETVALYPHLTGVENVDLFCRMAGMQHDAQALEALLEGVGLSRADIGRRVAGYSKGMRQKVGLAIGRAKNAEALLLDEPLSGLDPAAANDFCDELTRIRDAGAAVLMTTHDLFRAKELGGTIGIMRQGRLLEVFPARDVQAHELERIYLHHMRTPAADKAKRTASA